MSEKIKELISKIKFTRLLPFAISAVSIISVCGIIYAVSGLKNHLIWIFGVLAYLLSVIVIFIYDAFSMASGSSLQTDSFIGSMTLEMMVKMPHPVVICNAEGKIAWCNSALTELLSLRSAVGVNFAEIFGKAVTDLKNGSSGEGTRIVYDDRAFRVMVSSVSSKNIKYFLTLWDDVTEIETLEVKLEGDMLQVAYIMADNLEELAQYTKDGVRAAGNEIDKILK